MEIIPATLAKTRDGLAADALAPCHPEPLHVDARQRSDRLREALALAARVSYDRGLQAIREQRRDPFSERGGVGSAVDRLPGIRESRSPARGHVVDHHLAAAGKAPATRNRYMATLASVLTSCVKDWHWLTASPMTGVSKPTEDNGGTRFLSKDELDRLLTACRDSKSRDLLLAVMLSITTGGRQGEILGLRWKDLDLAAGTLHLRVDNETTTKGGIRSLPIAPQALGLLQARREARREGKVTALHDDGLVFPSRVAGSRPVSLRTPWETALLRAGIESFRWHDLRYPAASFVAKGGASLLEIGAVLGHKSANTTKRYAHLTEQHTNTLVLDMADKLLGGR